MLPRPWPSDRVEVAWAWKRESRARSQQVSKKEVREKVSRKVRKVSKKRKRKKHRKKYPHKDWRGRQCSPKFFMWVAPSPVFYKRRGPHMNSFRVASEMGDARCVSLCFCVFLLLKKPFSHFWGDFSAFFEIFRTFGTPGPEGWETFSRFIWDFRAPRRPLPGPRNLNDRGVLCQELGFAHCDWTLEASACCRTHKAALSSPPAASLGCFQFCIAPR